MLGLTGEQVAQINLGGTFSCWIRTLQREMSTSRHQNINACCLLFYPITRVLVKYVYRRLNKLEIRFVVGAIFFKDNIHTCSFLDK